MYERQWQYSLKMADINVDEEYVNQSEREVVSPRFNVNGLSKQTALGRMDADSKLHLYVFIYRRT